MKNDAITGTLSSRNSDCDLFSSSQSYDTANSAFVATFDVSVFSSVPSCAKVGINPYSLGYDPSISKDILTISIDIIGVFSALAVANKVNGPNTLQYFTVVRNITEGYFQGVLYMFDYRIDITYPQMAPMICFGPKYGSIDDWNCGLEIGQSVGVPFLSHSGRNLTYPTRCDCSDPQLKTEEESIAHCNNFSFLTGAIFWDASSNASAAAKYPDDMRRFLPLLEFFYQPPVNSGKTVSENIFPASWTAVLGQNNSALSLNQTWRDLHYAFPGYNSYGEMQVMTFHSWVLQGDRSITTSRYQLTNGACNNAMASPYFTALKDNPWGKLTESYYECRGQINDHLLNAFGVASSAAGLFVSVCILLVIRLVPSVYGELQKYLKARGSGSDSGSDSGASPKSIEITAKMTTDEKVNALILLLNSFDHNWGFESLVKLPGDKLNNTENVGIDSSIDRKASSREQGAPFPDVELSPMGNLSENRTLHKLDTT
jgi:hypothetical protein